MKIYPTKVCEVCLCHWQPMNRYQSKRNKTCSPVCNAIYISRKKKGVALKEEKERALTAIVCPVCGTGFQRQNSWLKRVKTPTCSKQCNGKLRAKELVKHSHKARAAWTEEGKRSYMQKMRGENNPAWKGGVTYRHRHGNYVSVRYVRAPEEAILMTRKDGYVMEHRLAMARRMGRTLLRSEVVHHLDHNPLNNELKNLELWPCNRSHKMAEHGLIAEGVANRLFRLD